MEIADRTIWTLWYQGFDKAPPLVRACVDSWRRLNPEWRVVSLDQHTVHDWIELADAIDLRRRDLTVQKISAIARLCLLRRYGGVWTDATVFCLLPLDRWLADYYSTGFVTFRNPGPDRLISNWFIASEHNSALLAGLHDAFLGFMNSSIFSNQDTEAGRSALARLGPILNRDVRRSTRWLSPWVQNRVRAYPYFIFHYTFNKLILTNPDLRALWEQAPPLDARPPHSLQALAKKDDGLPQALDAIDRGSWMLQKLDWRVDLAAPYWNAIMKRLDEHVTRFEPAVQPL